MLQFTNTMIMSRFVTAQKIPCYSWCSMINLLKGSIPIIWTMEVIKHLALLTSSAPDHGLTEIRYSYGEKIFVMLLLHSLYIKFVDEKLGSYNSNCFVDRWGVFQGHVVNHFVLHYVNFRVAHHLLLHLKLYKHWQSQDNCNFFDQQRTHYDTTCVQGLPNAVD